MRDILIAGGGPAGLAAGIRAAQLGLDAAVVEPKPGPIDKACGEGLMPSAVAELEALGVGGLEGSSFVGIRYLDAFDPGRCATGDFSRPGLGVRRTHLHQKLLERARQSGVDFIEGRVEHVAQHDDCVEAAGMRARFLVGADGLHSRVRRELGIPTKARRQTRFGVRRHFRCAPWTDRVEVYWADAGEAYVTPVGPQTVGVAFLAPGGARFSELVAHFPALAARIADAEPTSEARGGGPFEMRVARRVERRVLLVGDAAGYLDPLTGEGVALGVKTACAAVEALASGEPHAYERRYRKITREYYLMTGLLLAISRRRWLHGTMIDMLDRAPALFDACLHLLGGRR